MDVGINAQKPPRVGPGEFTIYATGGIPPHKPGIR